MSRFAQSFLIRFCMFCAYTRPRYKVNFYRPIGSLVVICTCNVKCKPRHFKQRHEEDRMKKKTSSQW